MRTMRIEGMLHEAWNCSLKKIWDASDLCNSVMREYKLSLTWRNDLRKGFNVSHLLVVELAPVYFAFHIFIYFSYFGLCMNVCAILRHIKRPKKKIWLFFLLSSDPAVTLFLVSLSLYLVSVSLPLCFLSLSFLFVLMSYKRVCQVCDCPVDVFLQEEATMEAARGTNYTAIQGSTCVIHTGHIEARRTKTE